MKLSSNPLKEASDTLVFKKEIVFFSYLIFITIKKCKGTNDTKSCK